MLPRGVLNKVWNLRISLTFSLKKFLSLKDIFWKAPFSLDKTSKVDFYGSSFNFVDGNILYKGEIAYFNGLEYLGYRGDYSKILEYTWSSLEYKWI